MCDESLARESRGFFVSEDIEITGKSNISDFSNIGSVFEYCSALKVRYIRLRRNIQILLAYSNVDL